ncbi:aminotransferase class V-fold PLP-dependent enzyme [Ideonella sp. B508-1]|uniref:aminotransferase class V-fold PLP-dependent enzyme n=1 Tax=Ideonella sp. B508-1 TaxID=137716 RepID=UPI00034565E9|nr:aminotransferase class V-fold PLP-dependent enzyme [Ideonella sp. B508-1]
MEIYLDANATTHVLPQALEAAAAAMEQNFGNPSSTHTAGLKARALLDDVRARARRILGAGTGHLMFTSGATEGIQTAVLSALMSLKAAREQGASMEPLLLYGATEHKAVPAALHHWNRILGLDLEIIAIPVDRDGRHDLVWLAERAPRAGLVCTMAANNETGVISDLDGIERALRGSKALWLVDGVQALGKISLNLGSRAIDYAPFSGHKLYAPKGVGMLYVREGAPFTPLLTGGGQEGDLRSGTENMVGIAALGAVFKALEERDSFKPADVLAGFRTRLCAALKDAFPSLRFNAPLEMCLPTTINFCVEGVNTKVLLDLFDAAGIRVSGGSACSAAKAKPSDVLEAMGLSAWQASNAVRLSFGPAESVETIEVACQKIRSCGQALRATGLPTGFNGVDEDTPLVTRYVVDGSCCYLICSPTSDHCVVIDPLPELSKTIAQQIASRGRTLAAVLDTHSHADHASSAPQLWAETHQSPDTDAELDALGWPIGQSSIAIGDYRIARMATPGHTSDAVALLLLRGERVLAAFVGDTVMPGALGRSDFPVSLPLEFCPTLRQLDAQLGRDTLLYPGHDYDNRHATTLGIEYGAQPLVAAALDGRLTPAEFAQQKAALEASIARTEYNTIACGARVEPCTQVESVAASREAVAEMLTGDASAVLVDVRELYEQRVDSEHCFASHPIQSVPVPNVVSAIPGWLALPLEQPIIFFCRSGNRSTQVARALRRLGRTNAWSLVGGLALQQSLPVADAVAHA